MIDWQFKKAIDHAFTEVQEKETKLLFGLRTIIGNDQRTSGTEPGPVIMRKLQNGLAIRSQIESWLQFPTSNDPISRCDLLDIEWKRLIHVRKNSRRSNVLGHLFK